MHDKVASQYLELSIGKTCILEYISIAIETSSAAEGFTLDPYLWYLLLVETPF